ncbi:MAG: NADH-quinone oxidoreductase subunit C [Candidatus Marinimicrobia bacterium]|nr:NADH-quinone oxidoreductase subunit C [Candidatus Neomarinimicrobiota bacterium]
MDFAAIVAKVAEANPKALVPLEDEARHMQIKAENWLAVAQLLKADAALQFDSLMCVSGYDKGPDESLGVAYNLHSMTHFHTLEVRIEVSRDGGSIPSVAQLWRTADWHEREAYDLFGITFEGHPDLRRILLPEDWENYPLRKDYVTQDYYHGISVPKDKRGWE